jgi:hypothetical protein
MVPPEQVVVPYKVLTGPVNASGEFRELAQLLYDAMSQELEWQSTIFNFYTVVKSANPLPGVPSREELGNGYRDARYVITGTVSWDLYDDGTEDEERKLYTLTAWVPDEGTASRSIQVASDFIEAQEVLDYIPFLIWQLTSVFPVDTVPLPTIPPQAPAPPVMVPVPTPIPDNYAWKDKWLNLGLRVGGSLHFYEDVVDNSRNVGLVLDGALSAEFQFLSFYWPQNYISFALRSGVILNMDSAVYLAPTLVGGSMVMTPMEFSSYSLSFPLDLKVNLKPGLLALGIYGGVYFNLPLQNPPTLDFPLGLNFGLDIGTPIGPGPIYLDLRYSIDLGRTIFPGSSGITYRRSFISVSLGYSLGLFQRPNPINLKPSSFIVKTSEFLAPKPANTEE